jgi:hypothetical protein
VLLTVSALFRAARSTFVLGCLEEARYSGPADNPGGSPDPMPWTNPANIAFDKHTGSLLVTNHASLVPYDPSLFLRLQRIRRRQGAAVALV